MKKMFLASSIFFILAGCAQLRQAKIDFEDCWNDPACREEAVRRSEDVAGKAIALAALSPIPGTAAVARPLAAGVGLLVFLIAGGRAIRKKKEETISA